MKRISVTPLALFVFGIISSCCKAGLEGDATVVVFLKHHSTIIPNDSIWPDSVFVYFGQKELPSDYKTKYDAVFVGEAGEDHVHLPNLKCGKYYLFGSGYDNSIHQRVSGGMAIKIKHSERKQELDVDLPVTE